MTRINVGIEPEELPNKLLLAEHREITRIPNAIKSGRAKFKDIPLEFTLGRGHVKFFYLRCSYLKRRYAAILRECRKRQFNVTDKSTAFTQLPPEATSVKFSPGTRERTIILERIASKGFSLLPTK